MKYHFINIYIYRIGHQSFNRRLPLKIQIHEFFRIIEIKFILKTNTSYFSDQRVLFNGEFDHEILELKNKYGKFFKIVKFFIFFFEI